MEKVLPRSLSVYPTVYLLSRKECEVLTLVAIGMNSKEISIQLDVLPKSIDNYKNRITKKLGLQGYGSLARFALENRIILLGWSRLLHPEKDERCLLKPMNMVSINSIDMENISGGKTILCDSQGRFNVFDAGATPLSDEGNQRIKLFNAAI